MDGYLRFRVHVEVEANDREGAIKNLATGKIISAVPIPDHKVGKKDWPLWAKALSKLSTPVDKGIGDTVERMIGNEKSTAFKLWFKSTFGKDCGCAGRQALWNKRYPLNR